MSKFGKKYYCFWGFRKISNVILIDDSYNLKNKIPS